jgi:molecular chaperone DnaJ
LTPGECYQVLGLGAGASTQQIRQAYRRLAHRWHPDRNSGDPRAEEQFKKLVEAYRTLTRTEPPPVEPGLYAELGFFAYLGSLLRDLVRKMKERPRRGEDLGYHLTVSPKDLAKGGKFLLDLPDKKLEVRVPPGTHDGARIRIAREGEAGLYGGPPGDLIVTVATSRD